MEISMQIENLVERKKIIGARISGTRRTIRKAQELENWHKADKLTRKLDELELERDNLKLQLFSLRKVVSDSDYANSLLVARSLESKWALDDQLALQKMRIDKSTDLYTSKRGNK